MKIRVFLALGLWVSSETGWLCSVILRFGGVACIIGAQRGFMAFLSFISA